MNNLLFFLLLSYCVIGNTITPLKAQSSNGTIIQAEDEMCSTPYFQVLKAFPDSSSYGINYSWIIAGKVLGTGPEYQLSTPIASTFDVTLVINTSNGNVFYANKSIKVKQTPSPQIINGDTTLCPNQNLLLTVKEKYNETSFSSLWFNEKGDAIGNNKSITISENGTYYSNIEKDGCISLKDSTYIKVLNLNIDSIWAESPKIHIGERTRLEATVSGDTDYFQYRWQDVSGNVNVSSIPSEYFYPPITDNYYLLAYNEALNCRINSNYTEIYVGETLSIPTAFTPNNDNVNDQWVINGLEIYNAIEMFIYNRWGQLMFQFKGKYNNQWKGLSNGKSLPIGVYYYAISFPENKKEPITGTVMVLK